jgi:hypothetical protein
MASAVSAENVKTKYFSVSIPDSFTVQTDNFKRIVAFPKGSSKPVPLLVIEYSDRLEQFRDIQTHINQTLSEIGNSAGLESQQCVAECEALYGEAAVNVEDEAINQHFYLLKAKDYLVVITYSGKDGLVSGRSFIEQIAQQVVEMGT